MQLKFSKMQGSGNDFVVFDAISQNVRLSREQVQRIAHRHKGIGCDQVLLVEQAHHPQADFYYRIFNADGAEIEQCGNGARCVGRFVHVKQLTPKTTVTLETKAGLISVELKANNEVTVNMGKPRLEPRDIPFLAPQRAIIYNLAVAQASREITAVSMGNPHAVQFVSDIDRAPVKEEGPLIEQHPLFPQRVNAGFVQVVAPGKIRARVYERGAGETLACGTGACASVVAGRLRGLLNSEVEVEMPGGQLFVNWAGEDQPVFLTGPAHFVFEGSIDL